MKSPIISIIIPVYNVEPFIGECLDSICSQIKSKEDVEVIVINDGTKDNSMKIVQEYAGKCDSIVCYSQENKGLSSTRNRGIDLALGKYLWFVDSDDWLKQDALAVLFDAIRKHPNVEIFVTPLTYVRGGIIEKTDIPNSNNSNMTGRNYAAHGLPTGASQRYIIKRSFLVEKRIRFIEGILHEDGPFGYMLMWYAERIKILKSALYNYRQRGNSIMHSIKIKSSYDLITGHKRLISFMEANIPMEEQETFRVMCRKLLYSSYTFVKPIWESSEFRLFEKENKNYISVELNKVMKSLVGTEKIYAWAFSHCPKTTLNVFDRLAKAKSCVKIK